MPSQYRLVLCTGILVAYSALVRATGWQDPSPHEARLLSVAPGVKLEVLDWGGTGRSVVLLAGSGGTAHEFDDFAPILARDFHVYGVTRRGYGASSMPRSGYSVDRLGDDVVAVMRALRLDHPILVGHSFGGQEVSDVVTRYPALAAGAVYLDAVHSYDRKYNDEALYWNTQWKSQIRALQQHLAQLLEAPSNPLTLARTLRDEDLPQVTRIADTLVRVEKGRHGWVDPSPADLESFATLREWYHRCFNVYLPEAEFRQMVVATKEGRPTMHYRTPDFVDAALSAGEKPFHHIPLPALYIGAAENDHGDFDAADPEARANADAYIAYQNGWIARRTATFLKDAPLGRLVIEQRASHQVFISNEADVLREIHAFAATLDADAPAAPGSPHAQPVTH